MIYSADAMLAAPIGTTWNVAPQESRTDGSGPRFDIGAMTPMAAVRTVPGEPATPHALPTSCDALAIYLREMSRFPQVSAEEEAELARRVQQGDAEARERMITANLRLVVHIARRYQDYGLPLLDLISEGNIGLMKAVDRFDPSQGRRLSSYAGTWITQRIQRALANQGRLIRLPVNQVLRLIDLRKSSATLQSELGREATDEEIADEMSLPAIKITRLRSAALSPASLDATLGEDTNDTLASIIADENCSTPEQLAGDRGDRDQLCEAINSLSPREILVLTERFGLNSGTERTLEEVGAIMGVTRERVRQMQNRALAKLRRRLRARLPEVVGLCYACGK